MARQMIAVADVVRVDTITNEETAYNGMIDIQLGTTCFPPGVSNLIMTAETAAKLVSEIFGALLLRAADARRGASRDMAAADVVIHDGQVIKAKS